MDCELVTEGTLYVVATPLGNLGDITDRAREVLRGVPMVAAEDTRRTRILLDRLDAHPRIVALHAHSRATDVARVIDALEGGEDVALVTDAGTPSVSDPGAALARAAREAGVATVAVPGPSAVTAALSISGLPADRFLFLGFLPRKGSSRAKLLKQAVSSEWTVVLFESPERLVRLLEDLARRSDAGRTAAVARELTKVHEECRTGTLSELAAYYRKNKARGEVTVILEGSPPHGVAVDRDRLLERARELLASGGTKRDVAGRLADEFAIPRREAYQLVNEL
ncbi:MAG: 16S rRNA (cytidine(1402)-2'-O)-methyltransferase [Gemmatimonadales bacterium]